MRDRTGRPPSLTAMTPLHALASRSPSVGIAGFSFGAEPALLAAAEVPGLALTQSLRLAKASRGRATALILETFEPTGPQAPWPSLRDRARDGLLLIRLTDAWELDRECFPPGISYSRSELRAFLSRKTAETIVVESGGRIVAFVLGWRRSAAPLMA